MRRCGGTPIERVFSAAASWVEGTRRLFVMHKERENHKYKGIMQSNRFMTSCSRSSGVLGSNAFRCHFPVPRLRGSSVFQDRR